MENGRSPRNKAAAALPIRRGDSRGPVVYIKTPFRNLLSCALPSSFLSSSSPPRHFLPPVAPERNRPLPRQGQLLRPAPIERGSTRSSAPHPSAARLKSVRVWRQRGGRLARPSFKA